MYHILSYSFIFFHSFWLRSYVIRIHYPILISDIHPAQKITSDQRGTEKRQRNENSSPTRSSTRSWAASAPPTRRTKPRPCLRPADSDQQSKGRAIHKYPFQNLRVTHKMVILAIGSNILPFGVSRFLRSMAA